MITSVRILNDEIQVTNADSSVQFINKETMIALDFELFHNVVTFVNICPDSVTFVE